MAGGFGVAGGVSGNLVEVDADKNLYVRTAGYDASGVELGGGVANAPAIFGEIDGGTITGERDLLSPEIDDDFRMRTAGDNNMDEEIFADSAQNTNKFSHTFTTMTATQSSAGLLTNSGNITTATTGMTFGTFAQFPVGGTQSLIAETVLAVTALPNANQTIDIGAFQRGASNPYSPLDGAYFRVGAAGIQAVLNTGGVEVTSNVLSFVPTLNKMYKYLIQISNVKVTFWIDNVKYATINRPDGAGGVVLSRSLPWSVRHAIAGGTAGAAQQLLIKSYRIISRGASYSDQMSDIGNRIFGSYAGLSGGTMGALATFPNSTNPTAATPSNTALTANLPSGLGGQGLVTALAAAATDLIFGSYQVPAGSATVNGKRLVIRGVHVSCINMGAAVATTATVIEFKLAFGHTAVSLATANTASFATATTKAPRLIGIGFQSFPVGAAIGQSASQGGLFLNLIGGPVYVNPAEFVALVGKFIVGTATASQTIQFQWQPVYGWE